MKKCNFLILALLLSNTAVAEVGIPVKEEEEVIESEEPQYTVYCDSVDPDGFASLYQGHFKTYDEAQDKADAETSDKQTCRVEQEK